MIVIDFWLKWILGIISGLIILGIPTIIGYVISTHETMISLEIRIDYSTTRIAKLEKHQEEREEFYNSLNSQLQHHDITLLSLTRTIDNLRVVNSSIK